MIGFLLGRLPQAVGVMLVVALLAFVLFRFAGDPLTFLLGQEATAGEREIVREQLGLNAPLIVQFGHFIGNALRGEFGISYQLSRPVVEVIATRLPATLELAFVATVIAIGFGLPMGLYAARYPRSLLSKAFMGFSLVGISLPSFFLGVLLIYWLSIRFGLFPSFGRGETVRLGAWWTTGLLTASGLRSIVLPAITLSLFQLGFLVRLVRAEAMDVLRADFIRFARARGLREGSLLFSHVLRNTSVPVITVAGLQIGSLTAFAIITESVFQWPGVGFLFINAVRTVDIPVMAAYLMLVGLFFVVVNLVVDLLYLALDPRIRRGAGPGTAR
ncbi:ABC transporter permease [Roseomonas sp. CAU 1739]|uniref:ABC transporter permease n=1 Tax=Roseomonas sp. CAU 1739 TaxID=3140364 RepID=UPI00325C24E1